MKIINTTMDYFKEAVDLAFENYNHECSYNPAIDHCCREDISNEMAVAFQNPHGFLCLENEKLIGYLIYSHIWNNDGILWCNIPLWASCAIGQNRTKPMSMLFQRLAQELFATNKLHFEIKLYAHDTEMIQLFSFLQFGIQCEEGIRYASDVISYNTFPNVKELTKEEIIEKWDEIWGLLKNLIAHLQKSPVFYPGTEFTEEVYKDFLLENDTRLVAAQIEEQLVGIITANKGGNSFINNQADYYNVGDIYVEPKYRGSMTAQKMLAYLSDTLAKEGIQRLWVEHGTANPNARGFWDKYFTAYCYTMIRDIEVF